MSAHERTYRLLLRAYPEGFRSAYGREMEQVFRDQRREATKCGVRFWAETVWDVVLSAPALRVEATRARWYEDTYPKEGKMKTMASLAMLIGAVVVASALAEGWAGGFVNHDGRSLMAGMLGVVAGALLLAAGIGLLRRAPRAEVRAQGAAIACLGVFALITFAAPRMSVLTTLLGFGLVGLRASYSLTRRNVAASRSRSLKRWILPVAVLGNSAMNSMLRGYLYGASRSFTKCLSSSSVTLCPALSTT